MSMRAGLNTTFAVAVKDGTLTEDQAVHLYWEVLSDLEWSYHDIDDDSPYDPDAEKRSVRLELFGCVST